MTARATFKQDDVTRAVRGVIAAGGKVARVEIEPGKIVVYTESKAANDVGPSDWDGL